MRISSLFLAESKAGKVESFRGKNREGFRYVLIGGCWHGEMVEEITRSGISYVIGWGTYLDFSGWS